MPAVTDKKQAFLGVDTGSISTKGVIIDEHGSILARSYLWTEGDPVHAARRVADELRDQLAADEYDIVAVGTTGSARRLVGAMLGAQVVKNEITAHAVGTTFLHPDVRTILEIGGQDSKIILVENGVAVDYAMNTLCAAGTGSFLSSQAHRLGVRVEDFGDIAATSTHRANIAARCTVFAESDLVHKLQVGYAKEDVIAGLCWAVASNYLNNVGKGKKCVPSRSSWAARSGSTRTGTSWVPSVPPCWRSMRPSQSGACSRSTTWTTSSSRRARWYAGIARTTARWCASTATTS